ncbi:GlcG/HbpS family heme-binding protein [Aeromonas media]|uniref:GlcG/HbpS family heme-binding protein n=1 Tax=Aeromonas media TaxID=651 RepID=UPI00228286EB|nr:heme-binding protein [Aeromonas media]MCY9821884.1 heme-binding protein [Aeromonas media]MDM5076913.1 heme-binding protein [Aeromonas media]
MGGLMFIRKNYALSAMVLALSSSVVWAETPLVAQRSDVTLSMANQLVQATLAACHAEGRTGVAAVVDRGGHLVALQRDDNVGPHNTLAAQRKAFTALSTKTATGLLAERSRSNPDAANLNTVAELLLLGGGVPLKVGDQVIGAIGVAGAGGAQFDEGCAQQAISHVLPTLK